MWGIYNNNFQLVIATKKNEILPYISELPEVLVKILSTIFQTYEQRTMFVWQTHSTSIKLTTLNLAKIDKFAIIGNYGTLKLMQKGRSLENHFEIDINSK